MNSTRRQFLKGIGKVTLAAVLPGAVLEGCTNATRGLKDPGVDIEKRHSGRAGRIWDPVYGPPIQSFSRYGGPGDFQGHLRGGAEPGIDYDVPKGTRLVAPMVSYLRTMTRDRHGALYILLSYVFEPSYRVGFGHLEDVLVDDRYVVAGDVMKYLGERTRAVGRGEIIALSGNSGMGPIEYGWVQPPHLHFALYRWKDAKRNIEDLDPDKYGVDGGRPVFWDGRALLDARSTDRLSLLEKSFTNFEESILRWREGGCLEEPQGILKDYFRLIGKTKGREILNSKHFHDMRSYLKKGSSGYSVGNFGLNSSSKRITPPCSLRDLLDLNRCRPE